MGCCSTCSQTFLLMPNDGLRSSGKHDEGGEPECEKRNTESQGIRRLMYPINVDTKVRYEESLTIRKDDIITLVNCHIQNVWRKP